MDELKRRFREHRGNVQRQGFLYRRLRDLEPISEGAIDARKEVQRWAEYNAETIRLTDHITDPLAAKIINERYLVGKTRIQVAATEGYSVEWIKVLTDRGLREIHDKTQTNDD